MDLFPFGIVPLDLRRRARARGSGWLRHRAGRSSNRRLHFVGKRSGLVQHARLVERQHLAVPHEDASIDDRRSARHRRASRTRGETTDRTSEFAAATSSTRQSHRRACRLQAIRSRGPFRVPALRRSSPSRAPCARERRGDLRSAASPGMPPAASLRTCPDRCCWRRRPYRAPTTQASLLHRDHFARRRSPASCCFPDCARSPPDGCARIDISSGDSHTPCAAMVRGPQKPIVSRYRVGEAW